MIVFLNGQFVPEDQAVVSVFDRGFLYGDGLFETMRVVNGGLFRWSPHLERLQRGAQFLKIPLPFSPMALREFAGQLISQNPMQDALLRLTLSRGIAPRGYSPKDARRPTLVMSLHPAQSLDPRNPPRWRLVASSVRLPANEPLAQFKTCNKLPQILARGEADAANADEGLLLNTEGQVIEGSGSNLFWIRGNTLCTPPLASGVLAGVTRAVVLEISRGLGLAARETGIGLSELHQTDGVFLTLSSVGIAEAVSLDGRALPSSPHVARLREAYSRCLENTA